MLPDHGSVGCYHLQSEAHHLDLTDLTYAHLEGAKLDWAHLEEANLGLAHLEGASLRGAHLEGANLAGAQLSGTSLYEAHLEGAKLPSAHLGGQVLPAADLERVRRWIPDSPSALPPADLRRAYLDMATTFDDIRLGQVSLGETKHGFVQLADVRWNGVNLTVVDWESIDKLGDEGVAREREAADRALQAGFRAAPRRVLQANWNAIRKGRIGRFRSLARAQRKVVQADAEAVRLERIADYREAVRANRQVAAELRAQGMNEIADRFAYRAQVLQRDVLWRQRSFGRYVLSWLGWALAGYGYKFGRSLAWYFGVMLAASAAYYVLDMKGGVYLDWVKAGDALVQSVTAFHGRGIFSGDFTSGDPRAYVAAIEAMFGLVIEVCFIVTFTQRFFGK